jgi:hypothetical protein
VILTLDFLVAFESVMSATRFLVTNQVIAGPYCTFAGLLLLIGELSSALWIFFVAVHTFLTIACGGKCREWVAMKSTSGKGRWVIVAIVWAWVILNGIYGLIFVEPFHPELGPFCTFEILRFLTLDAPSAAGWCWIGNSYFWERIFSFYCIVTRFII